MTLTLLFLLAVALVISVKLWIKISGLEDEISRMKSLLHVIESRILELQEQNFEAMKRFKVQLLRVASRKPLTKEMIFSAQAYTDISVAEAQRVFKEEKDPIIWIDVRTPKEFSKKRIPGARSLPLNILQERFKAELPSEESKIFVYCSEGDRSCSACDFLSQQGYSRLYNIREGLNQWLGPTEGQSEPQLIHIENRG